MTGPTAPPQGAPKDAIRSWLSRGIHPSSIDPRRLVGRDHARRLLGLDHGSTGAARGWRDLASALQRHTLHNALVHLSPDERQVVTLAYMQGRTNRQIALILGVSVSTVRRRLWLALEHLDDYIHRTGRWISAILLLSLAAASRQADKAGRLVTSPGSTDGVHRLAAAVAVGTVAVAGFGLAADSITAPTARHSAPATAIRFVPNLPGVIENSVAVILADVPHTAGAPPEPTNVVKQPQVEAPPKAAPATAPSDHKCKTGDSPPIAGDGTDGTLPPATSDGCRR